jgi:hypothetical protein
MPSVQVGHAGHGPPQSRPAHSSAHRTLEQLWQRLEQAGVRKRLHPDKIRNTSIKPVI